MTKCVVLVTGMLNWLICAVKRYYRAL